jgi:hypothetical protein
LNRPFGPRSQIPPGAEIGDFDRAANVTMMGIESESGWQWLEWIRKGVAFFGTSGFQHPYDEFWQEDQRIFQMETAIGPPQPDLQVLVEQLDESSADQPGGGSAQQTTPEICGRD